MNILIFLQELASVVPNSSEIVHLMNGQSEKVRDAIKSNDSSALKSLISNNQDYANETGVTLY